MDLCPGWFDLVNGIMKNIEIAPVCICFGYFSNFLSIKFFFTLNFNYSTDPAIRARIHQYFISGTTEDCSMWRDDYYNCSQFRNTKKQIYIVRKIFKIFFNNFYFLWFQNKIVQNELARKNKRIEQSKANNVWEYRTEPPSDWNRPISDD